MAQGAELTRTLELLEEGRHEGLHLGGQLAVLCDGRPVADLAVGEAAPGRPVRRDDPMLWLSATKPVSAVLVARLWERGLLGLDDPVARHLPEFAAGGKEGVTVRHLLTHTGGLRMLDVGWPGASWEEIVARIAAQKLEPRWVPGRKAGYHLASSWFVLGELVRRLEGRDFPEVVRRDLFEPLGMDGCWIGMPEAAYDAVAPRLVPVWDTGVAPAALHPWHERRQVTSASPGGNGWGPMRELARFYEMLRRGGELDGIRILAPQTVEAMVARHRVGLFDHTFRAQVDWGLGVIVSSEWHRDPNAPYGYGPHASARTFGHSGYRSTTAFCDPEHGLVVALAVNGTPGEEAHRLRFRRLCTAIYEDLGLAADGL
ncbi:MAG TPA: serine hydrolase domain-containing protein [Thermoanaerobaculia bacterium]|nr:serine hydrolase domain-containing protein [Thermoanaerobaculia bacterium]